MKPRRNEEEIERDVLAATDGASITGIIFRANINHVIAKRILGQFEADGLVAFNNPHLVYALTGRGRLRLAELTLKYPQERRKPWEGEK